MKSPLIIVLGISSTLLGLYILVVSLLNIEEQADYHIGSYLSDHSNHNAFQFRTQLQQLQSRGDESRKFHNKIRDSQLVDSQLNRKSVQLTKSVDSYIHNLALVKKYQQGNMEFFVQLSTSRQSYQNCAKEIKQGLDIQDSKQLWNQYKKCFDNYQTIKDSIDTLYSKRNKYLAEIDQLLVYDPATNRTFDLEGELKKIKERYDIQNTLNDKNKENYIVELKRLQHKNQTKSSQHDENQREFNRAKLQYQICLKNLKEFRKCQDIAKALREYGYVESFQSLEDRIRSKRQMLVKLRQLVIQSREGGVENKVITEMYAKREKELIQTIKLRLEMGYDEMKECGCTQDQRKRLQQEFENAKMTLNLNKKQINELSYEIISFQKKIKETDRQRERQINEFREETERLKNRQTSNVLTLQQSLAILKGSLSEVNGKLNDFSPKLNSLDYECNQYKDRLALKLKDSQSVSECFGKKNFYDQLKSKAQLILRKDDASIDAREKVSKVLQSFIYPEELSYPQIIQKEQPVKNRQQVQTLNVRQEVRQVESRDIAVDGETLRQMIEEQVREKMKESVREEIEKPVRGEIEKAVRKEIEKVVREEVKQPFREEIIIRIEEKITIQVKQL